MNLANYVISTLDCNDANDEQLRNYLVNNLHN
jgi:hypothetical protein